MTQDFIKHQLTLFRIQCALGVILYPTLGYYYVYFAPHISGTILNHLVIALLLGLVFIGSFLGNWISKYLSATACFLYAVVTINEYYLLAANNYSGHYIISTLMIIFIVDLFIYSRFVMYAYSLMVTLGSLLLLYTANETLRGIPLTMLISLPAVQLMAILSLNVRIKLTQEVLSSKEQISNLLRILGHDIAGPITVVNNYSELLVKSNPSEELVKKFATSIKRNADAIHTMVVKIRELNALESGKKELVLVPFAVDFVVEQTLLLVQERFEQKKVGLSYRKLGINFMIKGDKDVFSFQIIMNLLTNALKFSPAESEVTVELSSTNEHVIISIIDHGVGMPRHLLDDLFSYHKKTSRLGTNGEKGTGFGMPLVKSFVEIMHGKIDIRSKPIEDFPNDSGTNITLIFPAII